MTPYWVGDDFFSWMFVSPVNKYEAIVIGTSAGGYNALSEILSGLPEDYPLPIIIVQHRAKDSEDFFEELLQRRCRITVKQADEKEKIKGGTIYTAPPDYHLLIESDRTFGLSSDPLVRFSRPSIDVLFESAASVYRDRLVGIILTGSNADGAEGIAEINRYGGLTVAQDPAEAQYTLMPQAAIDTGKVEEVWRLARMREFLMG